MVDALHCVADNSKGRMRRMNKALLEAQKRFRNQKGSAKAGFDNTPVPPGTYTAEISVSEVVEHTDTRTNEKYPQHRLASRVLLGDQAGRTAWHFPNRLDEANGISGFVKNVRTILGDEAVPGKLALNGEFHFDYGVVLAHAEEWAERCKGVKVEVKIVLSKTKKQDGTYYTNVYINRALGDDAEAVTSQEGDSDTSDVDNRATPPTKRRAVKR